MTKSSGAHAVATELRERVWLSAGVLAFFLAGYFGVGRWLTAPERAHSLASGLDRAIPLVPESAIVYWSVLPLALSPIFVVREPALFRRTALAYALAIALALASFLVYPVSSFGFRPAPETIDASGFGGWLLRLTGAVDPPMNLFPSLHLAFALLASLAAWRVTARTGAAALIWTVCIAVSVCTTKQHFVADVAGGAALALLADAAAGRLVRNGVPLARAAAGFGARGLALFALVVALFYGALFTAYALGLTPWSWLVG